MSRTVLCAMLLAMLSSPPVAAAQQDRGDGAAREQAFIEALRREDPASADRFIALREARQQAIAELRSAEGQVNAMPPDLRASFLPRLKQTQRKYADAELKILDFLDERDRGLIARLQGEIARVNRSLEERGRARDDLRKLLAD